MSIPTPVDGYECPTCKGLGYPNARETRTLEMLDKIPGDVTIHFGQGVMWCANGHVTVFDDGNILPVHEFGSKT
jgi:hypothetical protein